MALQYQNPKFEHPHASYVVNAINNFAALIERPDPVQIITWGQRQNREASKIKTLAQSLNKRGAITPAIRAIWSPTHRIIIGRLEKRIGRERTQWHSIGYFQARQLNRRAAQVNSPLRSLLWTARGESEAWAANLRARTYAYTKSLNILTDWPSAALRAIRKSGFGKPETSGPQERVTDLWELCIRYNASINRDRVYGARTINKSRRGRLDEP